MSLTQRRSTKLLLLALVAVVPLTAAKRFVSEREAADSFQRKLEMVQHNATLETPESRPSIFFEEEINAYFSERRLPNMPDGVKSVRFQLRPANVTAHTTVDFDELRRQRNVRNPMLSVFTGQHDCEVQAVVGSAGPGKVRVRVESVSIDGVSIPMPLVEMFIDRFVNPKYPAVGVDREYSLPARIDSAVIKLEEGVIVQR